MGINKQRELKELALKEIRAQHYQEYLGTFKDEKYNRSVNKSLRIPSELMGRIEIKRRLRGISFTQFIIQAITNELKKVK